MIPVPYIFLLFFTLLWVSCTQSKDGAMSLSTQNETLTGKGFYLVAELDSSRRVHLSQDSISLRLDSLWGVSTCFLQNLQVQSRIENDSVLMLHIDVQLEADPDALCASTLFLPDTLLRIPMQPHWESIRQIVVEGTPKSHLWPDSIRPEDPAWTSHYLDSIWVRSGKLQRDTLSFYLDSLFTIPEHWPRRTPGDTSLLIQLDSNSIQEYAWFTVLSSCTKEPISCPTRPDTLWPRSWILGDTAQVTVRFVCADTSKTYCQGNTYSVDSSTASPIQLRSDTTRYTSSYIIEKSNHCSVLDSWNPIQGTLAAKNKIRFDRTIFLPSPTEPICISALENQWLVINAYNSELVTDSAQIQEILNAFEQASISDPMP